MSTPQYSDVSAALGNLTSERDWFAEGAVEGDALITLTGPEKTGKSFLATDLTVAVQLGDSWLQQWPVRRTGPVVYFDAEYGVAEWARRYAAILRGRGITALADMQQLAAGIRHYDSGTLALQQGDPQLGAIMRDVAARRPALIVIDPLRNHLPPGSSENDSHVILAAFQQAALLRDNAECPVLLMHHLNKSGGASGSRALTGRGDVNILGAQGPSGGAVSYEATGRRCRPKDSIRGPWRPYIAHEEHENDPLRHVMRWGVKMAADKPQGRPEGATQLDRARTAYRAGAQDASALKKVLCCSGEKAAALLLQIQQES